MTLSARQSRVIAVSVLALMMTGLLGLVAAGVGQYRTLCAQTVQKQRQVADYRQLADNDVQLRLHLESLKRASPASEYYVTGSTEAVASANIQRHVKQVVSRSGGEVTSTQILNGDMSLELPGVGLTVQLRAGTASLMRLLYALEAGRPMFFLNDLSINARPLRARAAEESDEDVTLDIRFDIVALLKEAS